MPKTLIIDVAGGARQILNRLKELHLKPSIISNTNGHTDRTLEDELLRKETGAKLAIHELDANRLALDGDASIELGVAKPIEPDINSFQTNKSSSALIHP